MDLALPFDCSALSSGRNQNHLTFVMRVLERGGARPRFSRDVVVLDGGLAFEALLDGRRLLFDFADRSEFHPIDDPTIYRAAFKFHYHPSLLPDDGTRWFPFSPISFHDWEGYRELERRIEYRAVGSRIGCRQIPRFNATERRQRAQAQLRAALGDRVVTEQIEQHRFWSEVQDVLVSVCVPGYRNDILDRGQLQYMGLGACTISPTLRIELAHGGELRPGRHYLPCASDYSDLCEVVAWCERHREQCRAIGDAAKRLFQACLTGDRLFAWIASVLGGP